MKTGNVVSDYHRETATGGGGTLNMRCFGHANLDVTIGDGNTDDQLGLIDFIRGKDYFDYNGDCSLNETRSRTLGDIYNSEIVIVGAPQAETAFVSLNQESYWRSIKGYDTWKNDSLRVDRQKVVYAGGNDGMLHAFDDETGAELWAFVPPFIASKLPTMMAPGLNLSTGGGSAAIFGVDGSITAHDMYFQELQDDGSGNMELAAANWHTILVVPYGRGGAGFSVLNITDPNNPFHKYSIFNDITNNRILHLGQDGKFNEYPYFPRAYALNAFTETIQVTQNKNAGNGTTACDDTPLTGGNYCYQGHDLTLPNRSLSASDVTVLLNGIGTTNFTATQNSGDTIFSFADQITYNADPSATQDFSSQLVIKINPGVGSFGLGASIPYDYSTLGETWSSPRIFRIPNLGAGDEDIEDDKYVAVMGGGYGSYNPGIGTSVFVVDLVDPIAPGSVLKEIAIDDRGESDIVNSIPNSPVVVTADTATGISFSGALVYINDFEGKVTKINLTNMENDGTEEENAIALYDTTTLFWSDSSSANGRYMYHSMDATIGASTNQLWLFGGTGNIDRINSNDATVSNIMFGIRDENYPNYKNIIEPEIITARNLALCNNTTDDIDGSLCPESADLGWYVTLPNFGKVTNEPTVSKGYVYFPVYEPTTSVNLCDLGNAYLCATDDECGTNNSSLIGDLADPSDKCWYAGTGVVSKIVTFGDKIFANISGETSAKGDLISAEGLATDTSGYRSTWSENY